MKLNKSKELLCSPVDEASDFLFLGLRSPLEVIFCFHAGIRKGVVILAQVAIFKIHGIVLAYDKKALWEVGLFWFGCHRQKKHHVAAPPPAGMRRRMERNRQKTGGSG